MYDKWCKTYYGMSLHIDGACPAYIDQRTERTVYPKNYFGNEYQRVFDQLFNVHQRESEVSRQWRLSMYRPFQQDAFQRVISMVKGAIFQDSGYGIAVDNTDDHDFIWGNNFNSETLPGFIEKHLQDIFNDPNGYIVCMPSSPGYATETDRIVPKLVFIPSRYVKLKTDDELIYTTRDKEDETIWVINKIGYFRFRKDENGVLYDIDRSYNYNNGNVDYLGGYYSHMFNEIPAVVAGGIWNSQGFYDSWLNPAKSWADEYVSVMSSLQMVNKEASHPYIIEASAPCPDCPNHSGKVQVECKECPGGFEVQKCGTCHGTGIISRSPGDRMIAPPDQMGTPLVQIVNPDVSVNKLHLENSDKIYEAIMRSLHLSYIDSAQSGVAKDKDMETRYQFLVAISNDIFDRILYNLIRYILGLRNIRTENGVSIPDDSGFSIVKPIEFNIKTAQDLLNEYESANKANVPEWVLAKHIEDYVDKQYGGDEVLRKKTRFINDVDVLALKSDSDKQVIVMNGAATTRDWKFNLYLPKLLDSVIRSQSAGWFIDAGHDQILSEVMALFNAMFPEIPPQSNPGDYNDAA